MTHDSNHTPLAASGLKPNSDFSVPHGRAISICALILYFLAFNLSCVFYQLRGAAPGHYAFTVLSGFAGILIGGLFMDVVERRCFGPGGKAWRLGFLAFLLSPGLFGLAAFAVTDFSGNLFLNAFQPGLWTLALAPAFRIFFRHEPSPSGQAVWLGMAFGAGHLCWGLLLPLARFLLEPGPATAHALTFLNVTRCLLACALAFLVWKALAALGGTHAGGIAALPGRAFSAVRRNLEAREHAPRRKAAFLLLALAPCALINGTLGFVLFARSATHGAFPELVQLGMAFLFPLAGLWLAREAGRLRPLLRVFILCFALGPVLLPEAAFLPSWLRQSVLALCSVSTQGLYFCATLCMARLGPRLSRPALAVIAPCLLQVTGFAAPLARALSGAGPGFNLWLCCALAMVCLESALALRRVFPLPEPPVVPESVPESAAAETAAAEARKRAFAAAFDLSSRETELLDGILRGLERKDMGAELDISESTVKFHIRGLLRKTGMANRQHLLHFYSGWKAE